MTRTRQLALIQRRGDVELPAAGTWAVHPTSAVGMTSRRDRVRSIRTGGTLELATPPESSRLSVEATLGERRVRLLASTIAVSADDHGFSRWRLTGTLDDATTTRPVQVELADHGVHRRGDRAWARITGRAVAPSISRRRFRFPRTDVAVDLDLLLTPSRPGAAADAHRPAAGPAGVVTARPALRPAC